MAVLVIETLEAIFMNNMRGNQHFMIDCACKGKDGKYHGSHYKNGSDEAERERREFAPPRLSEFEHTFFQSEIVLLTRLELEHSQSEGQSPLTLVCNDCGREFEFTYESYRDLKNRMMREYNPDNDPSLR